MATLKDSTKSSMLKIFNMASRLGMLQGGNKILK